MAAPGSMTTDETLMRRIAEQRDQAAFELLTQRHTQAMYNTALHITCAHAEAEDALQEAWLDIWRCARTYRHNKNTARSWMCRVVACKALKRKYRQRKTALIRSNLRRERGGDAGDCVAPSTAALPAGVDLPEQEEAVTVLRRLLTELAPLDREILALYYGAAFTQHEIGRIVRLPQTTVSEHVVRSLARLQSSMKDAGFLAVSVVDIVCEALYTTIPVPSAMGWGTCQATCASARGLMRSRWSAQQTTRRVRTVSAAAALSILTIAGVLWAVGNGGPADTALGDSEPEAGAADSRAAVSHVGPAFTSHIPPARFERYWDFNAPLLPQELQTPKKNWSWRETGGADGSGCMETDGTEFHVVFQKPLGNIPLLVSFRYGALSLPSGNPVQKAYSAKYAGSAWWTGVRSLAIFRNLSGPIEMNRREPSWITFRIYLFNGVADTWLHARRTATAVCQPDPQARIKINLSGRCRIDDLCIREIAPGEVPSVRELTDALDGIPDSKRVGEVLLPGIKSPFPDRQASVQFFHGADPVEESEGATP